MQDHDHDRCDPCLIHGGSTWVNHKDQDQASITFKVTNFEVAAGICALAASTAEFGTNGGRKDKY